MSERNAVYIIKDMLEGAASQGRDFACGVWQGADQHAFTLSIRDLDTGATETFDLTIHARPPLVGPDPTSTDESEQQ